MTDKPNRRRSPRLPGYDYGAVGAYFVTVCVQDGRCLFGNIVDGVMRPNDAGRMAECCWLDIPAHFPRVEVDVFVVMPNHVHGILCITEPAPETGAGAERPVKGRPRGTSKTIGSVIRGFKIGVTTWMRQHAPGLTVWQRNYYEHVVRNQEDLHRIREYIVNNPARWAEDWENPARDTETPGIPDYPRRRL